MLYQPQAALLDLPSHHHYHHIHTLHPPPRQQLQAKKRLVMLFIYKWGSTPRHVHGIHGFCCSATQMHPRKEKKKIKQACRKHIGLKVQLVASHILVYFT